MTASATSCERDSRTGRPAIIRCTHRALSGFVRRRKPPATWLSTTPRSCVSSIKPLSASWIWRTLGASSRRRRSRTLIGLFDAKRMLSTIDISRGEGSPSTFERSSSGSIGIESASCTPSARLAGRSGSGSASCSGEASASSSGASSPAGSDGTSPRFAASRRFFLRPLGASSSPSAATRSPTLASRSSFDAASADASSTLSSSGRDSDASSAARGGAFFFGVLVRRALLALALDMVLRLRIGRAHGFDGRPDLALVGREQLLGLGGRGATLDHDRIALRLLPHEDDPELGQLEHRHERH